MRLRLDRSGPWIGVGGVFTLLFIAFPAFFLGFAPWWGIALIVLLLVIQVFVIARLARMRPAWCAYVPLYGLVAYFGVILLGVFAWGWRMPA